MAKKVFFSFHYADIWRVSQVRNSHVTKGIDYNHPIDKADWVEVKRKGDANIKKWIDKQMKGAGVTTILLGTNTHSRPYCLYEIEQSLKSKKAILVIRINRIKDSNKKISPKGKNPLDKFKVKIKKGLIFEKWVEKKASEVFPIYNWSTDDGYTNFSKWVDEATKVQYRLK